MNLNKVYLKRFILATFSINGILYINNNNNYCNYINNIIENNFQKIKKHATINMTLNNSLKCRNKEDLKDVKKTISCYEPLNPLKLEAKYKNLKIIKSNSFTTLLNIIRDKNIPTSEFRKYSKRLIRLLLEESLCSYYTENIIKESPCGYYVSSVSKYTDNDFIAVSILRSGDAILDELLNIMPDVNIGKILVQRNENSNTKDAIYFFDKLPSDIKDKKVILLDPMIATGGSAIASINILKSKGIKEQNILFVNIVSCEEGIKNLFEKFPLINIISGVCDPELLTIKYIAPGLGDFGDRYYGTH